MEHEKSTRDQEASWMPLKQPESAAKRNDMAEMPVIEGSSMIVHDLNPDAVAAMVQLDLAALDHEPESPIGQFSFHGCVGGVAAFRGKPPWEHHTSGDELLFALSGESELTILKEGELPVTKSLVPGRLVVIPQGCWHSNDAPNGVTFLYLTPSEGNEHSWDDPRTVQAG
jgi:mannose-6-phosphate isomerase-like protein (cupin superfamily)